MVHKSDLRPLSYEAFARILDSLTQRVGAFVDGGHPVDLVAPILRSGAITALHLASRLGVTRMFPLQYKYVDGRAIERLFEPPTLAPHSTPISTILLVDTNAVTGRIAGRAARDLHERYPMASIRFAAAVVDVSLPTIPHVESVPLRRA
jgi:hypothetical protein